MPNWTRNKIVCKTELIDKILSKDKNNNYVFDFNKIIKMPESLNIPASSTESDAVASYYLSLNEEKRRECKKILEANTDNFYTNYWCKYKKHIDTYSSNEKILNDKRNEFTGKLYDCDKIFKDFNEVGETYFNNIKNTGSAQWYDWCVNNWGTKWNVMGDIEISENKKYDVTTISFDTAWDVPSKIVEEIFKKCNDNELEWIYINEGEDIAHTVYKENGILYDKKKKIDLEKSYDIY